MNEHLISHQVHERLYGPAPAPLSAGCTPPLAGCMCVALERRIVHLESQVALLRQALGPEPHVLAPGGAPRLARPCRR